MHNGVYALSWKLTERQKEAIKEAWKILKNDDKGVVKKIEETWRKWSASGNVEGSLWNR